MRRVIVNADDFGLASGVTDGIVEAHRAGIVTSSSLMVKRPGTADAAALARRHPALSVGLHFERIAGHDVEHELHVQLELFRRLTGVDPTHLDSHHHVHLQHLATFRRVASALEVPLRGDGSVSYIGGFYGQTERGVTNLGRVSRGRLLSLIAKASAELTELGCHPGRVTDELASSYTREREAELATLTSPGLRRAIEDLGVRLVSFRDVHQ